MEKVNIKVVVLVETRIDARGNVNIEFLSSSNRIIFLLFRTGNDEFASSLLLNPRSDTEFNP